MKYKNIFFIFLIILNPIFFSSKEFKIINTILNSIDESEELVNQRYNPLITQIKEVKNKLGKKSDISNLNFLVEKEKELKQVYNNFIMSCDDYKKVFNKLDKNYFELAFKEAYNNEELKEIEVKLNEAQNKFLSLSKAGKIYNEEYNSVAKTRKELSEQYEQLKMQLMIVKYSSHNSKDEIIDCFKRGDNWIQKEMEFHDFYSEIKILLTKLENNLKKK